MKKNRILSFLLAISLLFCVPVHAQTPEDDSPVSMGSHSLKASVPLAGSEQVLDTAKAAIAYELNSDTLLYTWNADQRINPTGLVKILTALIVLEEGNLDDMVTVYRSTLDTIAWGAVSAGLKAGEKVPLRDLLLCVMVASANDAAAVMAAHIAGTQQAFVEKMNQRARELGCTDSCFTNVHGLFDENQYSTARDLAIIAEAALENEIFSEMFSLDNFSMEPTNLSGGRYFITTNYMMSDEYMNKYFDYRVTGGKPAAASSIDRSMICTAEVGNSRYLFVVMSAQSEVTADGLSVTSFGNFVETQKLMNFAFSGYTVRQVAGKGQVMYQYTVKNGQNHVFLRPSRDIFVLLPANFDKDAVSYHSVVDAGALQAPIAASDKVGILQISYQGLILANCDLVAMSSVLEQESAIILDERIPPSSNKTENVWSGIFTWVGILVIAAAALAVLVFLLIRLIRSLHTRQIHMVRTRKRKNRRSR